MQATSVSPRTLHCAQSQFTTIAVMLSVPLVGNRASRNLLGSLVPGIKRYSTLPHAAFRTCSATLESFTGAAFSPAPPSPAFWGGSWGPAAGRPFSSGGVTTTGGEAVDTALPPWPFGRAALTISAISSGCWVSNTPSQAKINRSPGFRDADTTSGTQHRAWCSGFNLGSLYRKSPNALDKLRSPDNRNWALVEDRDTCNPAVRIRSASPRLSGLWSSVNEIAKPRLSTNARESPM
mmetsp:Transcript_85704/g.195381  ORF Transcript_85704/g.195381 Transcript_85704/m.195381 type:complete len:236 (+) Transcript_85704:142-849(+)